MKVAVIGSSGGMGGFFVRYFLSQGHSVVGSDTKKGTLRHPKFASAASNLRAARGVDVLLIATPLEKTLESFEEVSGVLPDGALVVEITSVKGRALQELGRKVEAKGARLLSVHPLFGPSQKVEGEMKLCVIETHRDSLRQAKALFPGAVLVPMKAAEHDRAMGVILSLTHLLNIAYAGTVGRYLSPQEFRRLETPTSSVQLTLAEGVLSQNPSLYSRIQLENAHSAEVVRAFIDELESLADLIEARDRGGFEKRFSELSKMYSGDSASAMERVYQAFDRPSKRAR